MSVPAPQSVPADKPRISANQIGEYIFSTPAKKVQILKDHKLGNRPKQSYYGGALHGILGSFDRGAGQFSESLLAQKIQGIATQRPENTNQRAKFTNNAEMLRRFGTLLGAVTPPSGTHDVIYQNAHLEIDGITVSVRPEIITKKGDSSLVLTKLRFSKSKISLDASEVILLILLKYGSELQGPGTTLDVHETKIVDCYGRAVIRGHELSEIRSKQLASGLAEIRRIWPKLTAASRFGDFF